MKSLLFLSLVSAGLAQAQNAAPRPPAAPVTVPALTADQVKNVLGQLQELEKQILTQRGSNLSAIMAKLTEATASDQAAVKFFTECDVLVNSERKEATKSEARARAEQMERAMEQRRGKGGGGGGQAEEEGDTALGLRLGLRYLMLTLEAHETKPEDIKKLVPKAQAYLQDLVAAAPRLKGRALMMINRACGGNSPVIEAFQLERYLQSPHWSNNPTEFGGIYEKTLFPIAAAEAKDTLPTLWDSRINQEAALRKETMTEPEYELWLNNELPSLRWERANDLLEKGPSPINAMGDMLKVIKDFPSHADAPSWVTELRSLVERGAESESSTPPPPATSGNGAS